jgi:hypothetical protein
MTTDYMIDTKKLLGYLQTEVTLLNTLLDDFRWEDAALDEDDRKNAIQLSARRLTTWVRTCADLDLRKEVA